MFVGGELGEEEHASLLPRVIDKGLPETLGPPALNRDSDTQGCHGLCSPMLPELSHTPWRGLALQEACTTWMWPAALAPA